MKILIINSYPEGSAEKLQRYVESISAFSQYVILRDSEIHAGIDLNGISACVLTGSPKMITEGEYSPDHVDFLCTTSLPILGICYGHQLLAIAWNGEVKSGERIQRVFLENPLVVTIRQPHPLFAGLAERIEVDEDHREYVVPPERGGGSFSVLAHSPSCEVEAIAHHSKPQYGTQFHLERSGGTGRRILGNFCRLAAAEEKRLSS